MCSQREDYPPEKDDSPYTPGFAHPDMKDQPTFWQRAKTHGPKLLICLVLAVPALPFTALGVLANFVRCAFIEGWDLYGDFLEWIND